jgi:hypothetical protein
MVCLPDLFANEDIINRQIENKMDIFRDEPVSGVPAKPDAHGSSAALPPTIGIP